MRFSEVRLELRTGENPRHKLTHHLVPPRQLLAGGTSYDNVLGSQGCQTALAP